MIHRGIATFTLDYGKCPKWLFDRMVRLGREMTRVIICEFGPKEFIKRMADPVWFQALGTILAFDWNASGLTTILTAALKEAIRGQEKDLGVFICGGKGKTSLKTPDEIQNWGEKINLEPKNVSSLVYNSKMAAKVDSSLIQDGYQIYHHCFLFSKSGAWTIVQQGMNTETQSARRYHWFSENVKDLVCEPHSGIASDTKNRALNLVAKESEKNRSLCTELVLSGFNSLMKDIRLLRKHASSLHKMVSLNVKGQNLTLLELNDTEFRHHPVELEDFSKSKYLEKILWLLCNKKPENYEKILAERGVGPKTMRALSLISEVIYGAKPSYEDPARFSFAFGGKDHTPYPIDRSTYERVNEIMKNVVSKMKIGLFEKQKILTRLVKS